MHVKVADEGRALGDATPGASYLVLNVAAKAVAAKAVADAEHPCYGSLADGGHGIRVAHTQGQIPHLSEAESAPARAVQSTRDAEVIPD